MKRLYPMPSPRRSRSRNQLTPVDLAAIVASSLPGWRNACVSDAASEIVLHELAFGTSDDELFLLACAIKYAARQGKNVHVVCGNADGYSELELNLPIGPTFRD